MKKIYESTAYIASKIDGVPETGIVLGSGLGGLVNEMEIVCSIPYHSIPNFPVSTVDGHSGNLLYGILGGKKTLVMQGRFHLYEGYSADEIVFPIRVLKQLGIKYLFLSNASGGVNPKFNVGDLMVIDDHINLLPGNPLTGKNMDELGPRFPDMSAPYDPSMIKLAKEIAHKLNIFLHFGVYAAVNGPCYETKAEYKYIRTIGADAVGMSTVPEVIAAVHMGLPCFAISVITDLGGMAEVHPVTHEEVLQVAKLSEKKVSAIVLEMHLRLFQ